MFEEVGVALSDTENTLVTSLLIRRQVITEELQKELTKVNSALEKVVNDIRVKAELTEGRYQLIQQENGNFRLVEMSEELCTKPEEV